MMYSRRHVQLFLKKSDVPAPSFDPSHTMSTRQILPGGWKKFSQDKEVEKKEPMENFDWMQHAYDYKDCRSALDKVEGSREWLKNYTCEKGMSFACEMAMSIPLGGHHSGASATGILWQYKYLLNNWDEFVYMTKRNIALREYRSKVPEMYTFHYIMRDCVEYRKSHSADVRKSILDALERCTSPALMESLSEMTVEQIEEFITPLYNEMKVFEDEDVKREEEKRHRDLMGCLKFHHEHPIRWFDTRDGSTLHPTHPSAITPKAMEEMEAANPGYKVHMAKVVNAMNFLKRTVTPYSYNAGLHDSDTHFIQRFMREHQVFPKGRA